MDMFRIKEAVGSLADANAKAQDTQGQTTQAREDLAQQIGVLIDYVRSSIFASYEPTPVKVSHFEICPSVSNEAGKTTSGSMKVDREGHIVYISAHPANQIDGVAIRGTEITRDQFFDYMGATTVEGVKKLAEAIQEATLNLLGERVKIVENKCYYSPGISGMSEDRFAAQHVSQSCESV